MDSRCILIKDFQEKQRQWFAKLYVIEVTRIFDPTPRTKAYRRLLFADDQNDTIQGIIYQQDLAFIGEIFKLQTSYYVGGAYISKIQDSRHQMGTTPLQLTFDKRSFIQPAASPLPMSLPTYFPLTSFWDLDQYQGKDDQRLNIMCIVIQALPQRLIAGAKPSIIQEFIVVNEEQRPLILTLWEPFVDNEGAQLLQIAHTYPIVVILRPIVTTFYGISLRTKGSTNILLDPPFPQISTLAEWIEENKNYIDKIKAQKLYEKANQKIKPPPEKDIRQISQILGAYILPKDFWIKGTIQITNSCQHFYIASCADCGCTTNAPMDFEFSCHNCNKSQTKPIPKARLFVQISDDSAHLDAFVQDSYAENIIGLTAT
ncbi:replication protein A 70 kDa DNA-binding subunit B-like [Coffea eugenioides]|uniref:replication protein A 70 kDa DNA-binding subunit B-like n=1 Tax=Coffea eugenioides TaxID=49369 RepID=UPI000F605C9B|nr:replication protein A 70 kDa DNA-binding subunit B-like [Coffea eugenioides]